MSQMSEQDIATQDVWVPKVRQAVKDRAAWLLYLYRSVSKALPPDQVEKCLREAIRQFGIRKAEKDGRRITSKEWVEAHDRKGSATVFSSKLVLGEPTSEQHMGFCPLVELWREEGCTAEEVQLLCDIAMEADRARAEAHGLKMELPATLAGGAPRCRMILTNPED